MLAGPALACRAQVVPLHALLYAMHCSTVDFGWAVPTVPALPDAPNATNATDECWRAGDFRQCADGTCIPIGQPCRPDVCAGLGEFEACGDGPYAPCVPIGYCPPVPPDCFNVVGFGNCSDAELVDTESNIEIMDPRRQRP